MKNKYILSAALVTLFATIAANAQEGFGTNSPDPSSVIDMVSAKRGVLIPRVTLTATNVASPVTAPANSLMVYNTVTAGTAPNNVVPGFYYWLTDRWVRITNVDDIIKGSITSTDIVVTDGDDATFKDVQLAIANDAITTGKIAPGAVETSDIKDRAVNSLKLDGSGFTPGYVATVQTDGTVTYAAPSATATNITSDKNLTAGDTSITIGGTGAGALLQNANVSVATGGISTDKLAADAVTSEKIKDGEVKLADLATGSVNSDKIVDDSITSADIKNLTITGADIAGDTITSDKLNSGGANEGTVATVNADGSVSYLTPSTSAANVTNAGNLSSPTNDASILVTDGNGTTLKNTQISVANGGIITDKLAADAVTNAKLADNAVQTENIAAGAVETSDIKDGAVTAIKLAANGATDANKVATAHADGTVTYETPSTDATNVTNTKDLTAYTNTTTDVVPSIEVATGGTNSVLVATSLKVAEGGITTGKLAADAVTNAKLADNAVQTENIAAGAVETSDIKDGAVTTDKIGPDAVTNAKLADNAVQTENIAAGAVETSDIKDHAVTAIKLDATGATPGNVATVGTGGVVTYEPLNADNLANGKALLSNDLSVSAPEGATALLKEVTVNIKPEAVTDAKLAPNAVITSKIADDAVTAAKINADVAGAGLSQDASGALQVDTAAIATGDITGGTEITVGNGVDSVFKNVTLGIEDNAITSTKIKDGEVKLADLATGSVNSDKIVDASITGADIAGNTITSDKFNSGTAALGTVPTVTSTGVVYQAVSTANLADKKDLTAYTNTTTDVVPSIEVATGGTNSVLVATSLKVADGGITTGKLANGAVTTAKLADDAVTNAKLADNAVQTENIAAGAVETSDIKDGAVTTDKIGSDAVTNAKLADNAVQTENIAAGAVETSDIKDHAVTAIKLDATGATPGNVATVGTGGVVTYEPLNADNLANGKALTSTDLSVSSPEGATALLKAVTIDIKPNAVTAAKINADVAGAGLSQASSGALEIATDGVTAAMINPNVAGTGLTQDASGALQVNTAAFATGDVTGGTEITVANGVDSVFKDVTLGIADNAVTNAKMADNAIGSAEIINESITSADIKDGEVKTADIADKNVTADKLTGGIAPANSVATTDGNGVVTYQPVSTANLANKGSLQNPTGESPLSISIADGDNALLKNAQISVANGGITTVKLAADAVTNDKLADNAVQTENIAAGAVETSDIKDGAITTDKIGPDAVTNAKLADNAVQTENIAAGAVETSDIKDGAVTAIKLVANGATDANKVATAHADGTVTYETPSTDATNVTNTKDLTAYTNTTTDVVPSIEVPTGGANSVLVATSLKVAEGGITTGKLANGAVTTAKLADDAVTNAKLADNSVQTENIANGTIIAEDLATGSVNSDKIVDGSVTGADIAGNTITSDKFNSGTAALGTVPTVTSTGVVYQAVSTANLADKKDLTAYTNTTTDVVPSIEVPIGGANSVLVATSLKVAEGGITTGKLANGAVTTAKLADDAVTNAKLADNAVQTENIAAGAVETSDIKDGAVTTDKIGSDAVTNAKLADNAVQTENIANGTIIAEDLATGSVPATKLTADATDVGKVATVTSAGTVTYQTPSASAANVTNGQPLTSTDLSISPNGATALLKNVIIDINAGAVTNTKLGANAVDSSKIANESIISEDIKDGEVKTADLADKNVTAVKLDAGTGAADRIAVADINGNVTYSNAIPSGSIAGANMSAGDTSVTIGGATNGVGTVLKPVSVAVAADGITSDKIKNGEVKLADLDTNSVDSSKIVNESILSEDIKDGEVKTADIADKNVTAIKLNSTGATNGKVATADGNGNVTYENVSTANLADKKDLTAYTNTTTDVVPSIEVTSGGTNSVLVATSLKVADGGITTGKLANGAVTTAKLADDAVTNAKLADNSVQTENIANGTIIAEDLAAGSVTAIKLAANGTTDANKVATAHANGTVTYETVKASDVSYVNTTSGLTATTVQGAIDQIVNFGNTQLNNITLIDEADGKVTLVRPNGVKVKVNKSDITYNSTTGVYTFTNGDTTDVNFGGGDVTGGTEITVSGGTDAAFKDVALGIANNAVTTAKIANGTIIAEDLATGSVPATKLTADATDVGKVATVTSTGTVTYQSVSTANLADKGTLSSPTGETPISILVASGDSALLKNAQISVADNGITSVKIANESILSEDIKNGEVKLADLDANSVNSSKIVNESILSEDIKDGEVKTADLADKNVTATKLDAGTGAADRIAVADINGNVTYSNAIPSGSIVGATMSAGDTSVTIGGATNGVGTVLKPVSVAVAADGITSDKIKNGEVKLADLDANSVNSSKIVNESILSEDIKDGEVKTVDIADKNVTAAKLDASGFAVGFVATVNSLTGGVTYAAPTATAANVTNGQPLTSTDLSISGNGATALLKDVVVDIKAGAVTNSKINSNVAGVGLIKNTSTGALDVNVDGITSGKTLSAGDTSIAIGGTGAGALLKDANVSVATGGITATKINADVAGAGLVKNTSTGKLDIADGGVTTVKLADNSVNSSKIVNESILSEDIKDGTVAAIDMATPGNDKVLTSGSTGTVTWADKSTLAIEPWQVQGGTTQANANTQNIYQAGNVGIGLVAGDVPNTTDKLDVKGGNVRVRSLPTTAGAAKDKVVVADSQGVLKTVNASMSKVFYMPSVVFDTSVNGTFTKNLYQEYVNQFTGAGNPTLVSSPGAAAIPYYQNANELEYHILYYDTTVFSGVSLSASGVLTYTIIGPGTEASFMNILFVVK